MLYDQKRPWAGVIPKMAVSVNILFTYEGFLFSAKTYYIFFGLYGGSVTMCKIVCVAKVGITFPELALQFL